MGFVHRVLWSRSVSSCFPFRADGGLYPGQAERGTRRIAGTKRQAASLFSAPEHQHCLFVSNDAALLRKYLQQAGHIWLAIRRNIQTERYGIIVIQIKAMGLLPRTELQNQGLSDIAVLAKERIIILALLDKILSNV